jgi:RHS repeat-associated protein
MMMPRRCFAVLVASIVILTGVPGFLAAQQPITGTPPLASLSGGPFDVINLANLDVHFSIPVFSRPGKGMPFSYDLAYDSLVWAPTGYSGNQVWTPASGWGWTALTSASTGSFSSHGLSFGCYSDAGTRVGTVWKWWSFVYNDPSGTSHPFPGVIWYTDRPDICDQYVESPILTRASDNSGYLLNVVFSGTTPVTEKATTAGGVVLDTLANTVTDPNGNRISISNGVITDTLGTTALTISGTPPNNVTYTYSAPGANATVTVSYVQKNIKTCFNVSNPSIGEYTSSGTVPLVDKVTLPDGTYYQLTYENTSSAGSCTASGQVTGRIASVRLPTGGKINYSYTGTGCGNNNNCIMADGSPSFVTRTSSGVASPSANLSSYYTRQLNPAGGSNAQYTQTNVEDGYGNWTYLNFNGIYETQRTAYQGTSGGTILKATRTCYNAVTTGCDTSSQIVAPITQKHYKDYLNSTAWGNHLWFDYQYDQTYGFLTSETDYDYGNDGPKIWVTNIAHNTLSTLCTQYNVCDRPSSVQVTDGSGNQESYTTYGYDERGSQTHGSLTTLSKWISGSSYLTTQYTYNPSGTLSSVLDPNLTTTSYTYGSGSCNNAFPISVTVGPLTTSYQYNCNGGVVTQVTDVNNSHSSGANYHNDRYFWRPESTYDLSGVTTSYNYYGVNNTGSSVVSQIGQIESVLTNSSTSVVDTLVSVDALGRPVLSQVREGPTSSNWDTTQNVYDSTGHASFVNLPFVDTAGTLGASIPSVGYSYDGLGRYTSTSRWDGVNKLSETDYTYNLKDTKITVNGGPPVENPKQRQLEYDAIGRLTSVCELTTLGGSGTCSQQTGQTGYFTQYTYSYNGMTVHQGAQTRTFIYDGVGRLTQEVNPESGTTNYTYDYKDASSCHGWASSSPGDLVSKVDQAGVRTCYYYDTLHRLTDVGTDNYGYTNSCRRFRYDNTNGVNGSIAPGTILNPVGRLVEAETDTCGNSPSIITDEWFSYSPRGETTDVWESTPNSGQYYHTWASYWANRTLGSLSSNLSSVPNQTYGVDPEGRLSSVTNNGVQNPVTSTVYTTASYPSTGASVTVTYGSGDTDVFSYAYGTGWMNQIRSTVGAQPNQKQVTNTLGWNANGSLGSTSINDPLNTLAPQQNCTYYYDDLGRLATIPAGPAVKCLNGAQTIWQQDISYGNNQFGNITKQGTSSWMPSYQSNNQYVTGGGISYDADGNLLTDTFNSYTWDTYGNPASVNSQALVFDAFSRMVENTTAAKQYVYAPVGSQVFAVMSGATMQQALFPLPMGGMAIYKASGLTYAHADWLGSGRLVTNSTQSMVNDSAYAPFGEQYASTGIGFGGFYDFTGQQQWTTSGLDDFLFRRYHPVQGRWITPDPAGLKAVDMTNPQTWNRYAYVANNPLSAIDRLGLYCAIDPDGKGTFHGCAQGAAGFWWGSGVFEELLLPVYQESYQPAIPIETSLQGAQNQNGEAVSWRMYEEGGWSWQQVGTGINFLPIGGIFYPGMNGSMQAASNAAKNFMKKPISGPEDVEDPWPSQKPLDIDELLSEETLFWKEVLATIADGLTEISPIIVFDPNVFGCAGAQGLPCNDPTSVFYNNGNKPIEF